MSDGYVHHEVGFQSRRRWYDVIPCLHDDVFYSCDVSATADDVSTVSTQSDMEERTANDGLSVLLFTLISCSLV